MDVRGSVCSFCFEIRSDLFRRESMRPGICAGCSTDCLSVLNGQASKRGFHLVAAGTAGECEICDRDRTAVARMVGNARANICAGCVRKSRLPTDTGPDFAAWFKAGAEVAGMVFNAYKVVTAIRGIKDARLRSKEMARLADELVSRDQAIALKEMEDLAFAFNQSEWNEFEKLLEARRHDNHNALLLLGRARRTRASTPGHSS